MRHGILIGILVLIFLAALQPVWASEEGTIVSPSPGAKGNEPPVVEVGTRYETLNNNYANWREYYIAVTKKFGDRKVIYGSYRDCNRFSLEDQEILLGGYIPLSNLWTANAEVTTSTNHIFLPQWSALGNFHLRMGKGWGAEFGYQYRQYTGTGTSAGTTTSVPSEHITLEKYFGNWRAAYTYNLSQPSGLNPLGLPGVINTDNTSSHSFMLNYYYQNRSSITLNYTFGREVENVGPPTGVAVMDTSGINLWGSHWINDRWGITYGAGINNQLPYYTRNSVQVGLFLKF